MQKQNLVKKSIKKFHEMPTIMQQHEFKKALNFEYEADQWVAYIHLILSKIHNKIFINEHEQSIRNFEKNTFFCSLSLSYYV